jgi:hypothetical protein
MVIGDDTARVIVWGTGFNMRGVSCRGGEKAMALTRRQFLKAGTFGIAAAVLTAVSRSADVPNRTLRVALLHLAPYPGDLAYNRRLVETAVTTAAGSGAAWILTPELCISGYACADEIGTDWIVPPPVQSDRTRPDARLYGGRKCDCEKWAAAPDLSLGTLGRFHC